MSKSKSALPTTLLQATRYFSDPEVCVQFVAEMRWPDGPVCPKCGGLDHSYLTTRRVWKCKACKKQFSVKLGSIFEDSAIPLDKWLVCVWLIANSKNGISSHELGRAVGITQKSAWHVLHRIRLAMQAESFDKFDGGPTAPIPQGPGAFERFESLTKRLVMVPKTEIDALKKRERRNKRRRAAREGS